MKEELVSFDTAKLAKEKGFNWQTIDIWMFGIPPWKDDDYCFDKEWYHRERNYLCDIPYHEPWYYSPTQSHLQKWLREKHGLILCVSYTNIIGIKWGYDIHGRGTIYLGNSYEECLEFGLVEALKLIEI